MKKITKTYPNGVAANSQVTLGVRRGEIHALVGENGAGKTTLMKVLFGLEKPEEGEIFINGKRSRIDSPRDAMLHGIGMVHQHFTLVPSLTVAENMVLGQEPRKSFWFDKTRAEKMCRSLAHSCGFHVDPASKIRDLSVGMKQKVEILRALMHDPQILVLDEPTAMLTPKETDGLFDVLNSLKSVGHTIFFITHRLGEVKELSDTFTVMRLGKVVGTRKTAQVGLEEISEMMMGRRVEVTPKGLKRRPNYGDVRLWAKNINWTRGGRHVLKNVSFKVRAGEILGIAGVGGNGQAELAQTLTGLSSGASGELLIFGKKALGKNPEQIRNMGLSHIPENKMELGVAPGASVSENLISTSVKGIPHKNRLFLDSEAIVGLSRELIERFKIKARSPSEPINTLSGGNIQKVVVAREFSGQPGVIIANQPTQGIDVGTAESLRQHLVEVAEKGAAVLLISADLQELLTLSDRIMVMFRGEIVASFDDPGKVEEEELGIHMLGLKGQVLLDGRKCEI